MVGAFMSTSQIAFLIILNLGFVPLSTLSAGTGKCSPPKKYMKDFDIKRYEGTWYAQATKPAINKPRCVQSDYEQDGDGMKLTLRNFGPTSLKASSEENFDVVMSDEEGGYKFISKGPRKTELNCYAITGKQKEFFLNYCCVDAEESGGMVVMDYNTFYANPNPEIIVLMDKAAKEAGVDASGMQKMNPLSCPAISGKFSQQ